MARKTTPEASAEEVSPSSVSFAEEEEEREIQPAPEAARGHDIVVIGASAGGVRALQELVAGLPEDLHASVFVVLHVPPDMPSALPEILSAAGPLPAAHARDGECIEPGRIYVAPPDMHLLLKRGHVRVVHGPKENRHRPAVDALFRSAARVYGPRVVGIVLTGVLYDGSAGLAAIHSRGGTTVVQDPAEAIYSDMPRSAMKRTAVDHCLRLPAISALITRLSGEPVRNAGNAVSEKIEKESRIAFLDPAVLEDEKKVGKPSVFTCPDCNGVLWEIEEGDVMRFRCRVGHAFSPESMVHAQGENVERALWTALRALEERIALFHRLVADADRRGLSTLLRHFERKLEETEKNAGHVREALLRNPKD